MSRKQALECLAVGGAQGEARQMAVRYGLTWRGYLKAFELGLELRGIR